MRSARHRKVGGHDGRRGGRTRGQVVRLLTGGLASALALVGLVAFATPAFGHNDIVTASAACNSPLGSGFKITWTIENDYNETETGAVTSVTGGLSTLNGTTYAIAASPQTPYSSTTLTQTLPATSSGAVTIDISSKWSDGFTTTDTGSVSLSSLNCAAPKQTIAGHIYLCNNGNPTTTEQTGGSLAAAAPGLSTVGPTPNPLAATNVVAGTYTMTATSPPGYLLVTCGHGPSAPIGTSATQSVNVPSAGSGIGTFYVVRWLPSISLLKTASIKTYSAPGTAITYSYLVTNTGTVTLSPVHVADPMVGLSPIACPSASLVPGGHETCTATYTTTQADVEHGSVNNTGTATGTPPWGPVVSATSSVHIPASPAPSISVRKTANVATVSAVGQKVAYAFTITNTGDEALAHVAVADAQKAPSVDSNLGPITCTTGTNGDITLAPGAVDTCSATYTVTQADLTNGWVADTATVTGHPVCGGPAVTASSSLALSVTSLSVTKAASPVGGVVAGMTVPIIYTITVKNTGTATTTAAAVITDAAPTGTTLVPGSPACTGTGGAPTCSVAVSGSSLTWTIPAGVAPGASYALTFSVTANATDPTGTITNTATWTGPSCVVAGSTPCTTNTTNTPVTAAPVTHPTDPSTAVATTTAGTTTVATTATTPQTPPSTAQTVAFTGALLTQEWIAGLAAVVMGAALVILAHRRRPRPRHAASRK